MVNAHRSRSIAITILTLALCAPIAHANPGTAIVMTVGMHLLFGNLIIGIIEWIGLACFGASPTRAAIMIPANYISAFAGMLIIGAIDLDTLLIGDHLLDRAAIAAWGMLIVFTILGIIIELPLIALAFKKPKRTPRRVILAAISIHIVTGGLLAMYYASVTDHSLAKSFKQVELSDLLAEYNGPNFRILSIENETTIVSDPLDGSPRITIAQMPPLPPSSSGYRGYWLALRQSNEDPSLDLTLISAFPMGSSFEYHTPHGFDKSRWHVDDNRFEYTTLIPDFATRGSRWPDEFGGLNASPISFRVQAADLREPEENDPVLSTDAFSGRNPLTIRWSSGETETLALYNPVIGFSATPKCVTILPGNLVVLMLGDLERTDSRGIYLLSLESRTIAKVSNGRSPLVVIDEPDHASP